MKGYVFYLFLALLEVVDDSSDKPSRKGMYEAKPDHWCQWCPPGKHLVKACELNEGPSDCQTCPENRFMDKLNNETQCIACMICKIGRHEVKACTKTNNTICQCAPGKFWKEYPNLSEEGSCFSHTICPHGTIKHGTPYHDAVCAKSSSRSTSESHPTSQSQTTPVPEETTTRGEPILCTTTSSSVSTTCPNSHPVSCKSSQRCCDLWFAFAMFELAILIVPAIIFCYYKLKPRKTAAI